MSEGHIIIRGAREHNLKDLDLEIPRGRLTVITGVSGSGKSSLAFDTLFREGQRRFLETLPAFSRQFAGGFARPAVASIEGLGPAVAVSQRASLTNPRSSVGTLTEVWDLLRLLFARLGQAPGGVPPTRGLFSFNGEGACPACQGLGVEDRLDLELLVADGTKSLREGALRVSTPNGYLMYSQVTLPVLDQILQAHGGSVDIPWRDLSEEARHVVLYGSDRLKVPYGKHPLESRLTWTGITARPRPEGFYRGLVPVMEEILRGKRNDSILRFVRTAPCNACGGARLKSEALAVTWRGRRISELAAMTASQLTALLSPLRTEGAERPVLEPLREDLLARCGLMMDLGLGYLTFDRPAPTLSLGEAQRLRLLSLSLGDLRGLVVVLDEPTAGLHPSEVSRLLTVLHRLRDRGQTVVVVEHDATLARSADWLIDLGPGPGRSGGELLWSGPPSQLLRTHPDTPTGRWLAGPEAPSDHTPRAGAGQVRVEGLTRHNLRNVSLGITRKALHVIGGVSGAGKTTLLHEAVSRLRDQGAFPRILMVDASPIGRTPRSNAATYTGAFDLIRDLFAASEEARACGLGKGHFTFNTPGGRCETCEGAGVLAVGMRHLGSVELPCGTCQGRRFHTEVLAVRWRGRSIADVLEGSVQEAADLFADQPKLKRILTALVECGLGYLPLGQPATTLSGGEAQRVKLATELARAGKGGALIALDEPTTGLHAHDVAVLLQAWDRLLDAGHTLLVVDNDPAVRRAADRTFLLGPGSGPEGGRLVTEEPVGPATPWPASAAFDAPAPAMELRGVTTHNLQALDVAIPSRGLTVVTGPSGSGKSSLVFDTLLAEAQNRFNDLVSPWARRFLPRRGGAELESARNLQAAVAVPQRAGRRNPRSRVGTVSELDELLRLLFSRAGERLCTACGAAFRGEHCRCGARHAPLWSSAFSPNTEVGACPACKGLGFVQACDPDRLVKQPERALGEGALAGTRFGAYLEEPDGRFLATLHTVGLTLDLDFAKPWRELTLQAQQVALHGAGERVFEVAWRYKRGRSEGVHALSTVWEGLATLVNREYERVHLKAEPEEELEALLADRTCAQCGGERLCAEARAVRCAGKRLPEVMALTLESLSEWLEAQALEGLGLGNLGADLLRRLAALKDAGLGYLSADREVVTLSGGELQRLRLASALGGGLSGVTYVLDEPTQGLHPRDIACLGRVLRGVAEGGNAVVVVEHDPELMAQADHLLELGPGAGPEGGRLLAAGSPAVLETMAGSRTGRLLRRRTERHLVPVPVAHAPGVTLRGAHLHNLQDLDIVFPVGALTVVTGVSGSGKSTLVRDVLGASLRPCRGGRGPVGCRAVELHVPLDGVRFLAQEADAGGLSTVMTLLDLAEPLRRRFAATPEAKARKLTARHFSAASPGGRCEVCEGRGVITVAMDLLPDVTVGCEACGGKRFQEDVLACRVEGRTLVEVMDATVTEALQALPKERFLSAPLAALRDLGLGYLRLGQEARTLSAGEFQRLRLAGILAAAPQERTALLLDEPARGLGFEDVERLAEALRRLARAGHLVVAVEHDLELIAAADWVIDLGPEGGPGGGRLVAQGPPQAIVDSPASYTGRALAGRA